MEYVYKEIFMRIQGVHYDLDVLFPDEPNFHEEEICLKDYEYLKNLYPRELRWVVIILEEYLDRYEYEGSPMYMQYPDAVSIYQMAKDVWGQINFEGTPKEEKQFRDIIQLMVCQEIYIRRRRHDSFCKKFSKIKDQMNLFPYGFEK